MKVNFLHVREDEKWVMWVEVKFVIFVRSANCGPALVLYIVQSRLSFKFVSHVFAIVCMVCLQVSDQTGCVVVDRSIRSEQTTFPQHQQPLFSARPNQRHLAAKWRNWMAMVDILFCLSVISGHHLPSADDIDKTNKRLFCFVSCHCFVFYHVTDNGPRLCYLSLR